MKNNLIKLTTHIIITPTQAVADLHKEWVVLQEQEAGLELLRRCIGKVAKQRNFDPKSIGDEFEDLISPTWMEVHKTFSNPTSLIKSLGNRTNNTITLATPVCYAASTAINKALQKWNKKNKPEVVSWDAMIEDGNIGSLPCEEVFDDHYFTKLAISQVVDSLPPMEQKVAKLAVEGFKDREIATVTNQTRHQANGTKIKIYKKIRKTII